MAAASALLRTVQWALRALQLTSAALILAMHSYTLAALSNHSLPTPTAVRAVEGISGVAAAYALASLLVVCCLAGRFTFTSFVAVVLDFAFAAAFIYVAVANGGDSTGGCASGTLRTHFGKGKAGDRPKGKGGFTALPTFGSACRLQAACLAIAILCIFFFVFSILTEVALARQRQREKRHQGAEPIPSTDDDDEENPQGGHEAHQQPFPDGDKKPSLFARIFGRGKKGASAGEGESILPTHTTPEQLDGGAGDDIPAMQEQRHDDDNGYMHGGQQHQQQLHRYQETYPEQNIGYATSIRDDDDTSYYGAGGPPPPQPPSQVHHGHDDEYAQHNGYRDEQDHGGYDSYDHDISNARPSQPPQPQQQEQQTPGFGYPTAGYGLRPAGTGPGYHQPPAPRAYHYDDGVYDGA